MYAPPLYIPPLNAPPPYALTDDIEIPFVRMIMVFHNKDSESLAMQIAKKMISKRLKHNFNDRVFDLNTETIIEHSATVTTDFYKVT